MNGNAATTASIKQEYGGRMIVSFIWSTNVSVQRGCGGCCFTSTKTILRLRWNRLLSDIWDFGRQLATAMYYGKNTYLVVVDSVNYSKRIHRFQSRFWKRVLSSERSTGHLSAFNSVFN